MIYDILSCKRVLQRCTAVQMRRCILFDAMFGKDNINRFPIDPASWMQASTYHFVGDPDESQGEWPCPIFKRALSFKMIT